MIPEYYQFEGERKNDKEMVKGFYVETNGGTARIFVPFGGGWDEYDVKPETVRRVAAKPIIKKIKGKIAGILHKQTFCPNCEIYNIAKSKHCDNCGMAIDWSD